MRKLEHRITTGKCQRIKIIDSLSTRYGMSATELLRTNERSRGLEGRDH